MIKRFLCRLFGHKWRRTSEFSGGIEYRCDACADRYTSFCACPSYRPQDDSWFLRSGRIAA